MDACPRCGELSPPGALFCGRCGATIPQSVPPSIPPVVPPAPPPAADWIPLSLVGRAVHCPRCNTLISLAAVICPVCLSRRTAAEAVEGAVLP
ncbi:MAG: zinc ribbon domain-containing protein [Thermoplasmata archaeon]|nr:zinc ribbon domain-containing protein [Thermoplasmata archaeon]MCI4360027.1 zinc ribbon domain-containing protein [Thermoplasmata archaeon]